MLGGIDRAAITTPLLLANPAFRPTGPRAVSDVY